MVDQNMDDDSQTAALDDSAKPEPAERDSTQVCIATNAQKFEIFSSFFSIIMSLTFQGHEWGGRRKRVTG